MEQKKLTQRRVDRLKPRDRIYSVRDGELAGFGVRVSPAGRKMYFVQVQARRRRQWHSLGSTSKLTEPQARALAVARIADCTGVKPPALKQALFEEVGEMFFERYKRHWKESTFRTSRRAYDTHILPFFEGMVIGEIDKNQIARWFTSLGNRPGMANRTLPILSVLMQQAELYGYRTDNSNPCKGIPRYKVTAKERFLSADELGTLGGVLESHRAISPLAVSFLEFVILTGCRKGEAMGLQWTSYKHGHLYLPDSKTGPKTIFLSSAARDVLEAIPRTSLHVFSALRGKVGAMTQSYIDCNWRVIRERAGLENVRMHDLRHTYASVALEHGEHILAIGRLLGHADPETTLKYSHLANDDIQDTARAVSSAIGGVLSS